LSLILPSACLAVAHRIATGAAAILVRRCLVRVWCATAVLRIVLPVVTTTSAISGPISTVADILSVRVIYESIIIINIYFIVSAPVAVAAPTSSTPGRSNSHPHAE
jgi:hypothetical protein